MSQHERNQLFLHSHRLLPLSGKQPNVSMMLNPCALRPLGIHVLPHSMVYIVYIVLYIHLIPTPLRDKARRLSIG